jgi:glycosyltransferase involved in cell wall biosynthesis
MTPRRIQPRIKRRRDNGSGPRLCRESIAILSTPVINRGIKNRFHIIVPVYNAVKYIDTCLNSCYKQSYPATSIIIVDDASTDGTSDIIKLWMRNIKGIAYRRNDFRTGSPVGNIAAGIELSNSAPEDILVTVDGDDWLATEDALKIVNLRYQNDNVWLTYGGYFTVNAMERICTQPVLSTASYRRYEEWKTSHLRTFRRHLWDRIKDEDLRDIDGEYYKVAGDLALMYPLVEMAGLDRIRMVTERLYAYNNRNSLNEFRIGGPLVKICERRIRARAKYSKIPSKCLSSSYWHG